MSRAYSLGLYEKAMPEVSWLDKLSIAREAGYDFVEMSIDATEEKIARVRWVTGERRYMVRQMFDAEMRIGTLNVSALTKYALGDPDPEIRDRGLGIGLRALGLAADLGARVVMIPGYDVYYKPHSERTEALFLEAIRILAERAAIEGVQIGFETMENDFMNTVEKGMYYVNLINSNYLKLYPDIGNTTNACVRCGTDPLADLRLGGSALTGLHLKETKPDHYREIPYGTGHVDFPGAINTAWDCGVRRFVTEFWYKPGGETPAEVCRKFQALLDAAEDKKG